MDRCCRRNQLKRFSLLVNVLFGIGNNFRFDACIRKKLLRFGASLSAFAVVVPINFFSQPIRRANASEVVEQLNRYLQKSSAGIASVASQLFARQPLSKVESELAQQALVHAWRRSIREDRVAELKSGELNIDGFKMPIDIQKFGSKPSTGWSLYISMHGGGGAPKRLNDQQWQNQKRLYQPKEGIYVAPRAPTDTWNLWHQAHIDQLFDRLITNLIVAGDVNPDRVYLMGYSAGGDGVYQLAPRMADRFAAAAMMAGHPNETSPLGLRNLPFAIHVGGQDSGFGRNKKAAEWKSELAKLRTLDPEGYLHHVEIYPKLGHWMQRRDATAIFWMAAHSRIRFPQRIVWKQDDVTHSRFYWLSVGKPIGDRVRVEVTRDRQSLEIEAADAGIDSLNLLLNDEMLDLDQSVTVKWNGERIVEKHISRTIENLANSLVERGDPRMMFSAKLSVSRPFRIKARK